MNLMKYVGHLQVKMVCGGHMVHLRIYKHDGYVCSYVRRAEFGFLGGVLLEPERRLEGNAPDCPITHDDWHV